MTAMTDEDFTLAGEYVLGLLDTDQEAVVAGRIATDSDFAAEVEAWRLRLNPMLGPEHWPLRISGPKLKRPCPRRLCKMSGRRSSHSGARSQLFP